MVKYSWPDNGKAPGNRGPFHDSPCGPSTCHQALNLDYSYIMNLQLKFGVVSRDLRALLL
jgi:hypothetical protein